ncbi:MAG: PQQ-like beta-propeller repeat protein, partial [Planctomycetes bacterium]|nr:PQQ-like beta-propeller repeat protein [Planctomycetota bacterium]
PTGEYAVEVRRKNHFGASFPLRVARNKRTLAPRAHLEPSAVWSCPLPGPEEGESCRCRIVDVDGDGADDLLVQRGEATVACISGAWGRVLWSRTGLASERTALGDFDADGRPELLVVESGPSGAFAVACVSCATGRELWRWDLGNLPPADPRHAAPPVLSEVPAAAPGAPPLFLLLRGGLLHAVSARDRKPAWTAEVGFDGVPLLETPEEARGFVAGTEEVAGFDVRSGKVLWRADREEREAGGRPLFPGDLTGDGAPDLILWSAARVLGISGSDGEILFSRELAPGLGVVDRLRLMQGLGEVFGTLPDFRIPEEEGARAFCVVPDQDGDGGRDLLIAVKTQKNILSCVSGAAGIKLWDTVLPGPLAALGEAVDTDGDGAFEVPVSLAGSVVALLAGGRGDAVRWVRKGVDLREWAGTWSDLDRDGALDLVAPAADGRVLGLSGRTGKVLWAHELDSAADRTGFERPAGRGTGASGGVSLAAGDFEGSGYADGLVVASGRSLLRLQTRPGATAWRADAGGEASLAGATADGSAWVLAVTGDGRMTRLDPRDGGAAWRGRVRGGEEGIREVRLADYDADGFPDAFVFDNDGRTMTVASGRDGSVLCRRLLPTTTDVEWIFDADGDGAADVIVRDRRNDTLLCASGASGETLWTWDGLEPRFPGGPRPGAADLDGDGRPELLVPSAGGEGPEGGPALTVLDARGGASKGTLDLGDLACPVTVLGTFDAAGGRLLLLGSPAGLAACACPSGPVRWRFTTMGEVRAWAADSRPRAEGGGLLAGDALGGLYFLDPRDGSLLWARKAVDGPVLWAGFRPRAGKPSGQIVVLGSRKALLLSPGGKELLWETPLPDAVAVPRDGGFRFLLDLDRDGLDDLVLPLAGGRIEGVVPERRPFRARPLDLGAAEACFLASRMIAQGDPRAALRWLEGVEKRPDARPGVVFSARIVSAQAWKMLGKRAEAEKALEAAVEMAKRDPAILAGAGGLGDMARIPGWWSLLRDLLGRLQREGPSGGGGEEGR